MAGTAFRTRFGGLAAGTGAFAGAAALTGAAAFTVSSFAAGLRRAGGAEALGLAEAAVLPRRGDAAVFFLGEDLIGFIAQVSPFI